MTEHLTETEVNLFRDRTIGARERERIDAHVAECQSCLGRILPAEDLALAYSELTESLISDHTEEPFHLSKTDLRLYARGAADQTDRLIFESHLDICEECSEALHSLAGSTAVAHLSAWPAGRQSKTAEEKFSAGWRPAALVTPARAIAFAIIMACLLLALLVWQRKLAQPQDQTAQNTASPAPSVLPSNPALSGSPTPNVEATAEKPTTEQLGVIAGLQDNGRRIELDRGGKLIGLEELPEASRSLVQSLLKTQSLLKPAVLDQLTAPSITLMGDSDVADSFGLIGPSGIVIVSTHPTLRWKALKGATSYTVAVFDADFNRIASSATQTATQWTTPPLRRGLIYSWEVVAVRNGQDVRSPVAPAPRAQFKILEAEKLNELVNQKKHVPVSHLVLGVTYARFGLLTEAEAEFQMLAQENPDAPIAKRLLRTVREWRNR